MPILAEVVERRLACQANARALVHPVLCFPSHRRQDAFGETIDNRTFAYVSPSSAGTWFDTWNGGSMYDQGYTQCKIATCTKPIQLWSPYTCT
jgi:hypothetical protein